MRYFLFYLSTFAGLAHFGASPLLQASDYHSPRTAALGGAGHAGPLLNDAIYLNPSFTPYVPSYGIGLNYTPYSSSSSTGQPKGREFSASVQDGRNELFQAGAAYTKREDGAFVHLGIAKQIIPMVSASIGGKYFFNDTTRATGHDGVVSSTYVISETLQTSVTVDNVLETAPSTARNMFREYTLGSKYNIEKILLLYLDPHYTPNSNQGRFGYNAGVEIVMMEDFFLRGGFYRSSMVPEVVGRGRGLGMGFGWVGPRMSLDYGFERVLQPTLISAHSLGATIYF